jgi:hypothetical protein
VREPGGPQYRFCREHWRAERERERVEGTRRELARLFVAPRPLGEISEAIHRDPIAVNSSHATTPTSFAVAKFAERKGARV